MTRELPPPTEIVRPFDLRFPYELGPYEIGTVRRLSIVRLVTTGFDFVITFVGRPNPLLFDVT